jgi:Uma2 family endonuclease
MGAPATTPKAPRRKRRISEEEFMRLPDDGRKYELVNGEVKEVPAGGRHGAIGLRLGYRVIPHTQGLGYALDSSTGFKMINGNIRSPDVSFMKKERLPGGKLPVGFIEGAPDLAIEIVSPSEQAVDLLRKVAEYFESGAQQVWLLFPDKQCVTLYHSPIETVQLSSEDEITGGDLLPGFTCQVKELFELD